MKNITITRRVKIYVEEEDKQLKSEYYNTIRTWRNLLRNGANELLSYLYAKDQLQYYKFIDEATKRNYNIMPKPKKNATDNEREAYDVERQKEFAIRRDVEFGIIGAKGEPVKNTSDAYVLMSERLKGKVPMEICNCLKQIVEKTYKETRSDLWSGKRTLANYKNNIQMPFDGKTLMNIVKSKKVVPEHTSKEGTVVKEYTKDVYGVTLFGIPFTINFGKDLSGNKIIVDRCLSGDYKFCGSSIMLDGNELYLYMVIQMPQEQPKLVENKTCFAMLSITNPIIANIDGNNYMYNIGTAEEFLYRRRQIQELYKRAQINAKYSKGGKGRKRKMQGVDRYEGMELAYVKAKMHEYSRRLVDYAIKNECGVIRLMAVDENSNKDKANEYLLRNWSYHSLLEMIKYKCNKSGITLSYDKDKVSDVCTE